MRDVGPARRGHGGVVLLQEGHGHVVPVLRRAGHLRHPRGRAGDVQALRGVYPGRGEPDVHIRTGRWVEQQCGGAEFYDVDGGEGDDYCLDGWRGA